VECPADVSWRTRLQPRKAAHPLLWWVSQLWFPEGPLPCLHTQISVSELARCMVNLQSPTLHPNLPHTQHGLSLPCFAPQCALHPSMLYIPHTLHPKMPSCPNMPCTPPWGLQPGVTAVHLNYPLAFLPRAGEAGCWLPHIAAACPPQLCWTGCLSGLSFPSHLRKH
jgi:hypothetical protein